MEENEIDLNVIHVNHYGWKIQIYKWRNIKDIDIIFLDDGQIAYNKTYESFQKCRTLHPQFNRLTLEEAKRRMNQIVKLNNGHSMRIKEYRASNDIDIIFDDGEIVEHTTYNLFNTGCIAHPIEGRSNKNIVERTIQYVYTQYKNSAKGRHIDFLLTKDDIKNIIFQPCIYCGFDGSNMEIKTKKINVKYNGIDRIDSSIGYKRGNIVPCCGICNRAKHNYTLDEWTKYLDELTKYYMDNKKTIINIGKVD